MTNQPSRPGTRNPYHDADGVPKLKRSVFTFMDILGYKDMIAEADQSGTGNEMLARLHRALTVERSWLDDTILGDEPLGERDDFALKSFTDNIVMGWPIDDGDDAESEFGAAFTKLAWFQFRLALHGFFVRGAVSLGDAFVDDIAVFGPALTEACKAEAENARDPRIVLTPDAVESVKSHLKYYGKSNWAPQTRALLRDSDGQWFINHLDTVLIAEDEQGPCYEEFRQHKKMVEEKLTALKAKPPLWSKYAWVAGYHNFFCDLHSEHFSNEHKIDIALFQSSPRLITDGMDPPIQNEGGTDAY